jgi:hypothetical protein
MRPLAIPFAIWLGLLQVPPLSRAMEMQALPGAGEIVSIAVGLAGLTVAVYRLGVWRQEMHNTRDNVSAELARQREEIDQRLARIEQTVAGSREPVGNNSARGES